MSICVAIKNGRRDGITLLKNRFNPPLTAGRFEFEKITKQNIKQSNNIGIKFCLNLMMKMFVFNIKNSLY